MDKRYVAPRQDVWVVRILSDETERGVIRSVLSHFKGLFVGTNFYSLNNYLRTTGNFQRSPFGI